jgi:hypothetical protein
MIATRKAESIETYKKGYVYILRSWQTTFTGCIEQYTHPCIDFYEVGSKYSEGYYCRSRGFHFEYQKTIINGKGELIDEPAYAGHLCDCDLGDVEAASKILNAMEAQYRKLELRGKDKYFNAITALRAAGYRAGIRDEQGGYLIAIE